MVFDEKAAPWLLAQCQHESVQIFDQDKTSGLWIEFLPSRNKILNLILLNRQLKVICLLQEGINDNRNEQINEHLGHQDVEEDEKDV